MRFIAYPSLKRPQFYLSDKPNVIDFFIDKFFYFRKPELQLALSVLKLAVPNILVRSFILLAASNDSRLPSGLSALIDSAFDVIKMNKGTFLPGQTNLEEISFIIRKSKWNRDHDKIVALFFTGGSSKPFTVIKLGSPASSEIIQAEYRNSRMVHGKFRGSASVSIPEPLVLDVRDNITAYAESAINGVPFNDYQKLFIRKKTVLNLHIEIINACRNFLLELHGENTPFTEFEYSKYFYVPLETISNTDFGKKHASPLNALRTSLSMLEKSQLSTVWMHGDFWYGSVLYDKGKTGFIDWELFTERGVPLWDYFSLIFHIGARINYFDSAVLAHTADKHLLDLAMKCRIDRACIPLLFQCFLVFNVQERDRMGEHYWQDLLERYWTIHHPPVKGSDRIL